ncbi:MAG: hypothetical protein R6X02_06870 [Enhygromyxa sp.]
MRRLTVLAALSLAACSGGAIDSSSNTFSSVGPNDEGESETQGEAEGDGDQTGDGDGDSTGDGDGDGDPSGDGDGDQTGDGDGDGDQTGDGDGDGDGDCQRKLYTVDLGDDSWTTLALDVAWAGVNAPPCAVEPLAATYLEMWDQLLVWGADGMFYRRIGVTWQPPEPTASRWAVAANHEFDSVHYVPPLNGGTEAEVTFIATPTALIYSVYQDGATSYSQSVALMDDEPPGPPQASSVRRWATVQADPALLGDPDWWSSWMGFDNGQVYRFNGAFVWSSWPENAAPVFSGAPGSLDPSKIEAAWGNHALDELYFVGL